MKKLFLALSLLFTLNGLSAQAVRTNDITLFAGGIFTSNELIGLLDAVITDVTNGPRYEELTSTPAVGITYKHAVMDNWFVFGDLNFQESSYTIRNIEEQYLGDYKQRFYTVGIGSEYHYVAREAFQMYSGLHLGYTKYKSKHVLEKDVSLTVESGNNMNFVNLHLNLIGIRFGKKIAGIMEIGMGYKGIANLGLSYQF